MMSCRRFSVARESYGHAVLDAAHMSWSLAALSVNVV